MSNKISASAVIHPDVELGDNITIEDFCIIGAPNKSAKGKTKIGNGSYIRSHTVIYAGTVVGEKFSTGNKANIRENCKIGNNVSIGTLTVLEFDVRIEDDVRVHSQAFIPELTVLKKGAWIGPNVVITNAKYPANPNTKLNLSGVTIDEFAKIGANSTVLPGLTIGKHALVGAGSVVTKNVVEHSVVIGNPAKETRKISTIVDYGDLA